MREATGWGYEMVKHDFSTYDLLGQWGFEMGPNRRCPDGRSTTAAGPTRR